MKVYFLSTDGITRITEIYEDEVAGVEWEAANEGSLITEKYQAELPFDEAGISWAGNPEVLRAEQKRMMQEAGWHTIPVTIRK